MRAGLIFLLFPFVAHGATLKCNADLSTPTIPLLVTELNQKVADFSSPQYWSSEIAGTDFTFTAQTGLTRDIVDESEDVPTYIGKPSLRSLVVFNRDRSQIARFDVPNLVVQNALNLTVGSQLKGKEFRIHVFCQLLGQP